MRVGFIGVGTMGSAMARRALADGLEVVVYDLNEAATSALAERGAEIADSPRAVGERCERVAVIVLSDDQVRAVVCGSDGLLSAKTDRLDIVIHSTIHLPTLYEVEKHARLAGRALIDAGVSGSATGAESGNLAIMVGGDADTVERLRPLLDTYGGLVLHVGPLGAGMKAKVARNLLSFTSVTAIYEAMRIAEAAGVDLDAFARFVRHSEAESNLLDGFLSTPSVREGNEQTEQGRTRLRLARIVVESAQKDLSAAIELANSLRLQVPAAVAALDELPATWGAEPGPTHP